MEKISYSFLILDKSYPMIIEKNYYEEILFLEKKISEEILLILSQYNNKINREAAYLILLLNSLSKDYRMFSLNKENYFFIIENMVSNILLAA